MSAALNTPVSTTNLTNRAQPLTRRPLRGRRALQPAPSCSSIRPREAPAIARRVWLRFSGVRRRWTICHRCGSALRARRRSLGNEGGVANEEHVADDSGELAESWHTPNLRTEAVVGDQRSPSTPPWLRPSRIAVSKDQYDNSRRHKNQANRQNDERLCDLACSRHNRICGGQDHLANVPACASRFAIGSRGRSGLLICAVSIARYLDDVLELHSGLAFECDGYPAPVSGLRRRFELEGFKRHITEIVDRSDDCRARPPIPAIGASRGVQSFAARCERCCDLICR